MTTREPIIPQQLETVAEVVRASTRGPGSAWTGRELVARDDGVWHRMAFPQQRSALYDTSCGLRVEGREARTRLDGEPTCEECAA